MIRQATSSDCINLAALSIKVWLDNYAIVGIRREFSQYVFETFSEAQFMEHVNNPDCRILVCEKQGAIQGYALLDLTSHYKSPANGYEVQRLYIDCRFKSQGIGQALLNETERQFGETYWLYTWVDNAANGFYQHLGFQKLGIITFDISGHFIDNNVYLSPRAECSQIESGD
ncbi:MAG: GNAT family N-acetyltransferase [Vibrio sp.]